MELKREERKIHLAVHHLETHAYGTISTMIQTLEIKHRGKFNKVIKPTSTILAQIGIMITLREFSPSWGICSQIITEGMQIIWQGKFSEKKKENRWYNYHTSCGMTIFFFLMRSILETYTINKVHVYWIFMQCG